MTKTKSLIIFSVLCLFSIILSPAISHASPVIGFDPGNIMDNVVMTNSDTMSVSQIQNFLNSKVPVCDTNHAGFYGSSGTWYGPPFTCLKDYTENNLTAAQIVYNAAKNYNINPQVLLVLLQKEQALITDTWPASYQYKSATGYGCPDSTPGVCNSSYFGFTNQVNNAAKLFHSVIVSSPTWYSPYVLGNNSIKWSPNDSCGSSTVYIQNLATAALYDYTPYRPNQASLSAGYGTGDSCSSYGNRNFYLYFTDWFGSTYAFVSNGINYESVFDPVYYLTNNSDVAAACSNNQICAFNHFISYGLYEGRQSSSNFSILSYAYRYPDLRAVFGNNLTDYVAHYINNGRAEGRVAVGTSSLQSPIVKLNGVDYSAIYDFEYYKNNNPDLANLIGKLNDIGALQHFITYGMKEGRQAKASFNVHTYRGNYNDLRWVFGMNLPAYYMHYVNIGQQEGRIATGIPNFTPIAWYGGTDYSSIYDYQTYISSYPDVKNALGDAYDDTGALLNFINSGMDNGRVASTKFNVNYYRDRYPDLRAAFGSNLKAYYMHYLTKGKSEGRVADTDYYGGTTILNGVNYSAVYDFNYYYTHQPDVAKAIGLNDVAILQHFVTYGMKEGRQANTTFSVSTYKDHNSDLQNAFGNYLPDYYMHYINYGQKEGRVAI